MEIRPLAGLDGVFRAPLEDLVDQAVLARRLGTLEVVALGVAGDGFQRLAGMAGENLVQPLAPEASSSAPIDAAWPTQIVLTSGLMYCMVS